MQVVYRGFESGKVLRFREKERDPYSMLSIKWPCVQEYRCVAADAAPNCVELNVTDPGLYLAMQLAGYTKRFFLRFRHRPGRV